MADLDLDLLTDVLNDFQVAHPDLYPPDERVSGWACRQAISRQTRAEAEATRNAARQCALKVRSYYIARRLESSFPAHELITKAAAVRATPAKVLRAASATRSAPLIESAVAAGEGTDLLEEVSETWVELPRAMPRGDYIALPVVGDSMEPFLFQRDVVLVKLGNDVTRDTVIVARRNDGYVVKYVSSVGNDEIELTSLETSYPVVRIPRSVDRVVGTVVARLRRQSE